MCRARRSEAVRNRPGRQNLQPAADLRAVPVLRESGLTKVAVGLKVQGRTGGQVCDKSGKRVQHGVALRQLGIEFADRMANHVIYKSIEVVLQADLTRDTRYHTRDSVRFTEKVAQ